MNWFLVISLLGSDEVLVKQMESKEKCISEQTVMEKTIKVKKDTLMIESISCEFGYIEEDGSLYKQKQKESYL